MSFLYYKSILFTGSILMVTFFSLAETALTSLSTLQLAGLKEKHPRLKKYILHWENSPSEVLASVIVGSTLGLIGNGVLATSIALDLASHFSVSKVVMLTAFPALSAVVVLALGEIAPKIFSRYHAEFVARIVISPITIFTKVFLPITKSMLKISDKVLSVFGRRMVSEKTFLQSDELKVLLLSDDNIPLAGHTRRIFANILDFGNTRVSQVMKPRSEIQAVDLNQPADKIVDEIISKEFSRVPVYRGNIDNIVGIIYSRDLALSMRGGSLFVIDDLIRPAHFIPGQARTDQVLREFKSSHQHMALVVDEYGSTIGIVTIEDLVEEIVGDIWDEYDIKEKNIIVFPGGTYVIRASESLDRVSDELKMALPAGEYNTVGGWVLDLFGRIPRVGESRKWGGEYEIEIAEADKKKVQWIRLKKLT